MSFDIKLQYNLSEKNRITKNVTDLLTVTGTFKDATSIIDPVILIEYDWLQNDGVNYLTIPSFGRSYFVNNIKSVRNNLVELSCHIDVLSSWDDSIKANTAIIAKQENLWNLYLNDGSFKVYQNPMVMTKAFPSGFNTFEFVLGIAGGDSV